MDEKMKDIFSKNLKYYLSMNDKNQADLCRYLKVSSATVSDWCNSVKMPRTDKIQSICNWLSIDLSDLLTDKRNTGTHIVLNHEETEIIKNYRLASEDTKNAICSILHVERDKKKFLNA